jgi:protein-L-isoaspartate(D-aspartate) O-methyltransferase
MDLIDKKKILINELINEGCLKTPRIIQAMKDIPREIFVNKDDRDFAYADQPLSIGTGQTISAPHMVAMMTEILDPQKEEKVLEVGSGSGYQAAVLSKLVKKVVTMELESRLVTKARKNLKKAGIRNVEVRHGDGSLGYPKEAPYDKIIVTCATDELYPAWEEQLVQNGILLAPVSSGRYQDLTIAYKEIGGFRLQKSLSVIFVPLRH